MAKYCMLLKLLLLLVVFISTFSVVTLRLRIHSDPVERPSKSFRRHSATVNQRPPHPARPNFEVALDFKFPHPVLYRPVDVILKTGWVMKLKRYLNSVNLSRQVIVTEATYDFFENLVNWLISAAIVSKVPLQNVLVLCFDQRTHDSLAERNINSLYIPYNSIIKNAKLQIGNIWMNRLAVIRLLSHWGYDVQHYDTDAVLLKNPQPLFRRFPSSDIVASWGDYPDELGKNGPWGTTLCMGAVLIRSSPRTELLWKHLSDASLDTFILNSTLTSTSFFKKYPKYTTDDQCRLNFALKSMGLKWSELVDDKTMIGGDRNGLSVVVLPQTDICRHNCITNSTQDFYVSHPVGGAHNSTQKARKSAWFLRQDWNSKDTLKGKKWLTFLCAHHSVPLPET